MTTDTQPWAPTDAELMDLGHECELDAIAFGREVLKNWGQPAHSGEPVYAFRRKGLDDFCTCTEKRYAELSLKPNLFETRIFYTEPPVLAMGRVPLPSIASVEMIDAAMVEMQKIYPPLRRSECRQLIDAALGAAHGIKGGQHGADTRSN